MLEPLPRWHNVYWDQTLKIVSVKLLALRIFPKLKTYRRYLLSSREVLNHY
jgi:hypothetical protein